MVIAIHVVTDCQCISRRKSFWFLVIVFCRSEASFYPDCVLVWFILTVFIVGRDLCSVSCRLRETLYICLVRSICLLLIRFTSSLTMTRRDKGSIIFIFAFRSPMLHYLYKPESFILRSRCKPFLAFLLSSYCSDDPDHFLYLTASDVVVRSTMYVYHSAFRVFTLTDMIKGPKHICDSVHFF